MKVKVLSLLVPALLVAGAAQAAEVYNKDGNKLDLFGKVDGLHYFADSDGDDGDQSYVRLGFKGETQINDKLTGFGEWEYQFNANQSESVRDEQAWTRVGFAGLRFAEYGTLDYGRNYGVIYDVTSWTDVLPEFGGDTYGSDNFLQQRGNNLLTYRNSDFFGLVSGLNFTVQYQGENSGSTGEDITNNSRGVLRQNGEGIGAAVTYDIGAGFSAGAAASGSQRTLAQNSSDFLGNGDRAAVYSGGLKYDANNVYLAAQYTQTYNATRFGSDGSGANNFGGFVNKAQNFEAVAQYQFDFGLRPSIAYLQQQGNDIERGYGDQDLLKYVEVGATYFFNKNMSTYVDYRINLLDETEFTRKADISTDDIIAVGLVYQF